MPADSAYSVPHANVIATTDSRGLPGWTLPFNRVRWPGTLNSTGLLHCEVNILVPVRQNVGLALKIGKITRRVIVSGRANGRVVGNFSGYKFKKPGTYRFILRGFKNRVTALEVLKPRCIRTSDRWRTLQSDRSTTLCTLWAPVL